MTIEDLKQLCRSFPLAIEHHHGAPSNILTYSVYDKKFAYFKTSEPEQWRFSLRVMPERFLELTDQNGIKPARYMHRFHWISIVDVHLVPEAYLRDLVSWSFEKAVASLTKKRQREIGVGFLPK